MLPGRDVLWVLGGRTDTNRVKLKRILTNNFINTQVFHLCYNTKQMMQYGHFKKQRGIANSRSHELLFLGYKGRVPKQLAKLRMHVDGGSLVFQRSGAQCARAAAEEPCPGVPGDSGDVPAVDDRCGRLRGGGQ